MGIDEILDNAAQVEEFLRSGGAPEMPFSLHLILDVLIVALDRVVVVLQPMFPARDGNAEGERAHAAEEAAPGSAVVHKAIAHEGNELPLFLWFRFLLRVPFENLRIAG